MTTAKCFQCLKDSSIDHSVEYCQKFNEIEDQQNRFREILNKQTNNPDKHCLIQQINQWENDSIDKIRQLADRSRKSLLKHINEHIEKIEKKLIKLNEELNDIREEHNLNEFKEKIKQLEEELNRLSNISIKQNNAPFINQIFIQDSSPEKLKISSNTTWNEFGYTVAGRYGDGTSLNHLSHPYGMYVDDDDERTIYVADTANHRVIEWRKNAKIGRIVAGGNEAGHQSIQLNYPSNVIIDKENDSLIISDYGNQRIVRWSRKNSTDGEIIISNINCWDIAMDKDGYLYISNMDKHEVTRWKIGETNGIIVAGGNGCGNRLDQLDEPHHIFVDQDYSVYVSDFNNHRIMKWIKDAKEGIIVAGGQGVGDGLNQLSYPLGVVVDQLGSVYVADSNNDRIVRWLKGATQGSIIIDKNQGKGSFNSFNYPVDLTFDQENNLYVLDYYCHRVLKFTVISQLPSRFD